MGAILSRLFGGGSAAAAKAAAAKAAAAKAAADDAADDAAADSSSEPSSVLAFHSSARWQLHFNASRETSKLLVIDFSASWCGPCKFVEPAFNDMAARLTDVDFVKIDVDELSDVAQEFKVQAMPTFVLLKRGNEVDRVVGAKKNELETKIEKHRQN